jgi:hypothetical protein
VNKLINKKLILKKRKEKQLKKKPFSQLLQEEALWTCHYLLHPN